ncbi:APA family fibronectin-binding glycoprotein [Nocardia sp. NPDC058705]|uniref:APA family fibronectin-binding glycoprotein n=1 Tax=Nocardia sp. NPDC058705 TaxID=3346609 RepID=UPI0036949D60
MEPDEVDSTTPTVSRRAARWILTGCVISLIGSLCAIGYLAFSQYRMAHDDRIESAEAGISFVPPTGWEQRSQAKEDGGRLIYGQVGLQRPGSDNGFILIGKLDQSLFASGEADNAQAACSLGSGMGEFFFPAPGQRTDRAVEEVQGSDVSGNSCFYRVKFENGSPSVEVYAAVVGSGERRWWVCWLGDATAPVDRAAAAELAASIRPL